MDERLFWDLLGEVCGFGRFVAAAGGEAASVNIVGRLIVAREGADGLVERADCGDHVHLKPALIAAFNFIERDAGYGPEPCVELLTADGVPALQLYLHGGDAASAFRTFAARHQDAADVIRGAW
jgi:hypothetical protein